ncbi:MAG: polyphosphate kinase 2 family protein [Gammaproteobacteria bacterium]|nr:polyphosphate kinase 2 family protein [Gammaproteobacteria bacterium]
MLRISTSNTCTKIRVATVICGARGLTALADNKTYFPANKWLVPFDGSFEVGSSRTRSDSSWDRKTLEKKLKKEVKRIARSQRVLYAQDRFAVLLVFQAMDAAGKDGTIRAVMSGVNPAGCHVSSFKTPSSEELDHDWLWRTTKLLPERGRIGVFNRSYYEEVLAVKVHPDYLRAQRLPDPDYPTLWPDRYQSIREHELHLARNGTVILKFWLNVSQAEQKRRFLARLNDPEKYWKFSKSDLSERQLWPEYMDCYQTLLNETSRDSAPWYAIPADDKPYMRWRVAKTIADTLDALPLAYPEKSAAELSLFDQHRQALEAEKGGD